MYPLVVVDPADNIIGSSSYEEVHSKGLLHRFILVYVFDRNGKFFLQKRSSNKPHGCMFAESVCAHVRYGENYIDTAKRRLKEELGLNETIELKEVVKDKIYTEEKNWINNAFVKIYECITNQIPKINEYEVQEGKFLELTEVISKFLEYPTLFVPGFKQTFPLYLKAKLQSNL